ncbi:Replication factor C subunit 5, partial [Fragariocoptes setiger]
MGEMPWIEKYRPQTLEDLSSHEDIRRTLEKFIRDQSLPHLLFYGPPGTGKTSTILACARRLYEPQHFGQMVLEMNASDDRGIGIIRGPILNFASSRSVASKIPFKLIILDEADQMTNDAQNALRRIMEKYTDNARFCLISNYMLKIIPAIQSRCTRFRFGPLEPSQIMPRMELIVKAEGLNITHDGRRAILEMAEGDMRRVVNLLQAANMTFRDEVIDETKIYQCCGHPLKEDIERMVRALVKTNFKQAYRTLQDIKVENGLALQDIISEIAKYIGEDRIALSDKAKMNIYSRLADIEFHLNVGGSERIYMSALVGAFQCART